MKGEDEVGGEEVIEEVYCSALWIGWFNFHIILW